MDLCEHFINVLMTADEFGEQSVENYISTALNHIEVCCQIENVYTCCCSLQWPDWKEGSLAFSQDRSIGREQLGAIVACWLQTPGLLLGKVDRLSFYCLLC